MARVRVSTDATTGRSYVRFDCPGCGDPHRLPVTPANVPGSSWGWNGSLDLPTLTPSISCRSGHYASGASGNCWCDYEKRTGDKAPFSCGVCHSFVTEGRIQFLGDCTHALAGQTVDLPDAY